MTFLEKMAIRVKDNEHQPTTSIAFLGDSVTQGCFEVYVNEKNEIVPVFDQSAAYETYLTRILSMLYPNVPVTIINAGISGNTASQGFQRLDRDVLSKCPDLVIVCFGLNDSTKGLDGLDCYIESLKDIFEKLQELGIETIFMTPNMMATKVHHQLTDEAVKDAAQLCCNIQNAGILDDYIDAARTLCKRMEIPVCDCYAIWKQLYNSGVDVNTLLSNKINHPTREMNWLFAIELARTIFGDRF